MDSRHHVTAVANSYPGVGTFHCSQTERQLMFQVRRTNGVFVQTRYKAISSLVSRVERREISVFHLIIYPSDDVMKFTSKTVRGTSFHVMGAFHSASFYGNRRYVSSEVKHVRGRIVPRSNGRVLPNLWFPIGVWQ